MKTVTIVVAAGVGRRLGNRPKTLLDLGGKPLLCWSLDVLQASPRIDGIVVAVPPARLSYFNGDFAARWHYGKVISWVGGGAQRQDSMAAALNVVPRDTELVAVHDAARPFLTEALLSRVIEAAREKGAAVPGIEVVDTIKEIDEAGAVVRSPARERLRAVQTPQVFLVDILRRAYRCAAEKGMTVTDDAALVEQIGHPVAVVEGERDNIKVTVPGDIERAEEILTRRIKDYVARSKRRYAQSSIPNSYHWQ